MEHLMCSPGQGSCLPRARRHFDLSQFKHSLHALAYLHVSDRHHITCKLHASRRPLESQRVKAGAGTTGSGSVRVRKA